MKKFLALMITVAMVMALAISAQAATITINRDSTWNENGEAANATYTYYKIFDAVITTAADVDPDTGELDPNDGVVVYTLDNAAAAAALPALFLVNGVAPDTDPLPAASDGLYYITLADPTTSAADIAAALATMVAANTTLFPGTSETTNANPYVIDGLDDGYYLIEASNGQNLVVQTIGEVEINEKNDYPTIDKQQGETPEEYDDDELAVSVGSVLYYQVTIHIPENATKPIVVGDTMTAGLTYNDDLALSPSITTVAVEETDAGYNANATWQFKIDTDVVEANRGEDIVVTYSATVNANALTDTGRENEVTLTYDDGNYVLTDKTEYTTHFGGIYKVDPNDANADMSGVKFELTVGDDDTPVYVTYDETNGYYVVDPTSTSNEVETHADGTYYTIKIRGLDGDLTYYLEETETVAGYNLLEGKTALTLTEDTGTAFADKELDTFDKVENNKGIQLPSTGGIGTTIFYVIGGLMAAFAGVMLITKKRMSQEG